MSRHKRNVDLVFMVLKVSGVFILLFFLPGTWTMARVVVSFLGIGLLTALAVVALAKTVRKVDAVRTLANTKAAGAELLPKRIVSLNQPGKPTGPYTVESLVAKLRTIDWFQFEQIVGLAFKKDGFQVQRRGGANPDGGIDLLLTRDGIKTAVQCKHWKTWNVGVKAVREFLGALTAAGLSKGLFVTLGGFTAEAKQLAQKHAIGLISDRDLAALLHRTNAAADPAVLEILEDTRKLCPKCERELVLRTATKGRGAGNSFWGCSGYPRCRYTMPFVSLNAVAQLGTVATSFEDAHRGVIS